MKVADKRFYVAGGPLQPEAPSYVVRAADEELLSALRNGEFCYVLDVRQLGKSSLMVRTAAELRREGVTAVVLDLQAVGQPATAEEWYYGLLTILGERLSLEDELKQFWNEQRALGPLQRWVTALQRVVLPRVAGPLVLFVDEIDVVRKLSFSTDEFFAGIRECYHRRVEVPEFNRLTFCLLGVATPGDLIQDVRTTPFNIGGRIELNDFTPAEAGALAAGLEGSGRDGRRLLERVLFWTSGHPYMTQRLCQAIAADAAAADESGVDRLCEALFLSRKAQETENNLADVRNRILGSGADRASLLDLYQQIRNPRGEVRDTETNPLVGILRLSGIARVVDGRLRVRNRIYDRVFDRNWIRSNMPGAELRRQRAAYRRGWLGAAAVVSLVVGSLAFAVASWKAAATEKRLRIKAQELAVTVRHLLYDASMNEAQAAWEGGDLVQLGRLLDEQVPRPGQEDLREFGWYYLQARAQQLARTLSTSQARLSSVAFSPDGKRLASGSDDRTVKLWDVASGRATQTLTGHRAWVQSVAFSPDGKRLASGSRDGTVKLWDVASGRVTQTLTDHADVVQSVAFSPDGKRLASGSDDRTVKLWRAAAGPVEAVRGGGGRPQPGGRGVPSRSRHRAAVRPARYGPG